MSLLKSLRNPGVGVHPVKLLPTMLASHVSTGSSSACSISTPVSFYVPGKTVKGSPSPWALATHRGDPDEAAGLCAQPGLALATVATWRGNQQMEDLTFPTCDDCIFQISK